MNEDTMKHLINFINIEDERLNAYYKYPEQQKRILFRTLKLVEEVGELSAEILASMSQQRKEKIVNHTPQKLEEEFTDVLLTALLVAKSMNLNLDVAVQAKIEKINKRYEK